MTLEDRRSFFQGYIRFNTVDVLQSKDSNSEKAYEINLRLPHYVIPLDSLEIVRIDPAQSNMPKGSLYAYGDQVFLQTSNQDSVERLYAAKVNNGTVEPFALVQDKARFECYHQGTLFYSMKQSDRQDEVNPPRSLHVFHNGTHTQIHDHGTIAMFLEFFHGKNNSLLLIEPKLLYDINRNEVISLENAIPTRNTVRSFGDNPIFYIKEGKLFRYDGERTKEMDTDLEWFVEDKSWIRLDVSF